MKRKPGQDRPTIGLVLDNLFNDYEENIWRWIMIAAEEKDINLISFPGGSLESPLPYHSQRNSIYNHVSRENVDGLISISGSIGSYVEAGDLAKFFKRYAGIPFLSIGIQFDDYPSVTIDNTRGFSDLISHLIEDHGFGKIAFIRGLEHSKDAGSRYEVYAKTLDAHGLRLDPDLVVSGGFDRESGVTAVGILLDERKVRCEAIVAANDYMAIGAITECARRGIAVPRDIAITGFDDIEDACGIVPALSTVRQPYYELGRQALDVVCQIMKGNTVPDRIVFPTKCVLRQSCGCELGSDIADIAPRRIRAPSDPGKPRKSRDDEVVAAITCELESFLIGFKEKQRINDISKSLYDAYRESLREKDPRRFTRSLESMMAETGKPVSIVKTWLKIVSCVFLAVLRETENEADAAWTEAAWQYAVLFVSLAGEASLMCERANIEEQNRALLRINNALIASYDEAVLNKTLLAELPTLRIKSCYYARYEDQGFDTDKARIAFAYTNGGISANGDQKSAFASREMVPGGIKSGELRFSCIMFPLYFESEQLGFVIFELGPKIGIVYETLAHIISSVLKGAELAHEVRQHSEYLEQKVQERTADLNTAFEKLKSEIAIRHKVEEELVREKELAMVTLASIGDGVITTDINGTVTYMNTVAENLTGYKNDEARGEKLKRVLNVRYNVSQDIIGDQVDIVLGKDRGFKLSGAVILRSRDGREYTIKESISPIRDSSGTHVGVVIIIHNVSETEKMTKLINYQSTHDILTGVYNRIKFNETLMNMMEDARHEKKEHIFCYIDIDGFKLFNNTLDTVAGDELLRHVSSILKQCIRQSDVLGRIGGDQFGLLLHSCPLTRAKEIAIDVKQKINVSNFHWENTSYKVSVSIGVVFINVFSDDIAGVMSAAHAACNLAKKRGGNRIHVWSPENEDMMRFHSDLFVLPQITKALDEDRFCLYKQKIHSLGKRPDDSEHFEILVRMVGENDEIITPGRFIPPAERYNIMQKIDRWVITKLFSSHKVDYNDKPTQLFAKYSVNLSASSLDDDDFLAFLMAQFELFKVPPFMICFEITETTAISNFTRVNEFIKELKKLGCTFALDDFGSGWASFSYLKYLHIDFLKIDGSFVRDIMHDPIDFVLVETINHIGHVMGLQTIAEFVEDAQTLAKLADIGVNYAQGYGISMPEPF